MKKRVLFGASHSPIEPLGLLHLGGLARDLGWDRDYHLVKNHNFETLFDHVEDFKPDVVGFNVYTGNHLQLAEAFKRLKQDYPGVATVVGGPHATYFPSESIEYADFVIMSEGFGALKKVLNQEATPGIYARGETETFPAPDRTTFYTASPEHADSRIKSIITMTGCPYHCTYCYNSSTPSDINISPDLLDKLTQSIGTGGRLFPHNIRTVDSVIQEGMEIQELWPNTEVIYFQDDVHGFDTKHWMPEFAKRWSEEVGAPYHAQMRWEMTKDERRLDLLKKAGCFGLTLAIEAANPIIRKEVLDRAMSEELMFEGMESLVDRGFKVRTEQITGLPYGATSIETPMNLDADLELVELNVRLKEQTGGPTMSWGSTFAPYSGTKLGSYTQTFGHYEHLDNHDVPDTFFDKSVLRFPKEWVGQNLAIMKHDPNVWLPPNELETYRDQNAELRRHFNFFCLVPEGHKLAKEYLENKSPFSYERLGEQTEKHLQSLSITNSEAREMLGRIDELKLDLNSREDIDSSRKDFQNLAPYFASLPRSEKAIDRVVLYSNGGLGLDSTSLSTAIRHHLYDKVLYSTEN